MFDFNPEGPKTMIANAKLESQHNTMVLYTEEYRFFYVIGVTSSNQSLSQPIPFIAISSLDNAPSKD
jgi:hypothetical protein